MDAALSRFFTEMALDPNQLASFLANPEGAMQSAGLPDEVREIVRAPQQFAIADRLALERGGPRSLPYDAPYLGYQYV